MSARTWVAAELEPVASGRHFTLTLALPSPWVAPDLCTLPPREQVALFDAIADLVMAHGLFGYSIAVVQGIPRAPLVVHVVEGGSVRFDMTTGRVS